MFLHVMAAEVAACREYLTNKAIRSSIADVDSGNNVDIELSHQAMNHFFNGLDVLTLRRATPEAPNRAPHTASCSDEFIEEVVPNYFGRWDGYEAETRAYDRSHYQYLLTLNSQYGLIRGLREAINRAASAEARPTRMEEEEPEPYDYVGKYQAGTEGVDVQGSADESLSARADRLSRLAQAVREGSKKTESATAS